MSKVDVVKQYKTHNDYLVGELKNKNRKIESLNDELAELRLNNKKLISEVEKLKRDNYIMNRNLRKVFTR